jgi:surface polysaccharide O-acyltransferase-like enzyme
VVFIGAPANLVIELRLLSRWAVPFFFLVSGYFFYPRFNKNANESIVGVLKTLLTLFITSCVLFLPVGILSTIKNTGSAYKILSFQTLVTGTYFHLWFIGAMIFGYLFIWLFLVSKLDKLLNFISILIVLMILAFDSYSHIFNISADSNVLRYLSSIPLLNLGFLIAKHNSDLKRNTVLIPLLMVFLGIGIELLEAFLLKKYTSYDPFKHQILIGVLITAVGLLLLSINFNVPDNMMANYGRRYSLLVYLYHPLAITGVSAVFQKLRILNSLQLFIPVIVFIITVGIIVFIDKYMARLFKILSGAF